MTSLALMVWGTARAQAPPPFDPTLRSGQPPPFQQEQPQPTPAPPQILPQVPPAPGPELELPARERVFVREIRVVGGTRFTEEDFAKVTVPYLNREVTAEDLEALRLALTLLYVNHGYINSGAILPDQNVTDGVITYRIIEGKLTAIDIDGNRWFRSGYLRSRIARGAGTPLNVNTLQEQLQLLLEDERIRRLNADLRPGLEPGEARLGVTVEDRQPFRLSFDVDNYQPPAVGAERGIVTFEDVNVTGWGDTLSLSYGKSEGLDPLLDFRYAVPFTPYDTTLALQYRKNTFVVVESQFQALNIESESEIFTVSLRQPIFRNLNHELSLELTGERLSNQTSLFGEPFTLVPGAHHGEAVVSALRVTPEWVYRTPTQVVAARSRFSFGIPVLGATTNGPTTVPDSRFFVWLGQFQWVRRFPPLLNTTLVAKTDLQLTRDPLLVLEQVAVGGRYSVRGYRENTLLTDRVALASLEARVPLVQNRRWADYLQLAPFFDYGRGWNVNPAPDALTTLMSVGVGLRWAVTIPGLVSIRPQLEVYWGHPLRDVKTAGGNLQDSGVHFQLVVALF